MAKQLLPGSPTTPTTRAYPDVPDFEPLRFVESPQVLFTQLFQGEFAMSQLRDFALDQSYKLTPRERDAFTDKLKEATGKNPFINTLIDVVTNPFVWSLFVFSPLSAPVLKGGRTLLFDAAERMNLFTRESLPLLTSARMATSDQALGAHAFPQAMSDIALSKETRREPVIARLAAAWKKVTAANPNLKLKGMIDPYSYVVGTPEWEFAVKAQQVIHGSMRGWDRGHFEYILALNDEPAIRRLGGGWEKLKDAADNPDWDEFERLFAARERSWAAGENVNYELRIDKATKGQVRPRMVRLDLQPLTTRNLRQLANEMGIGDLLAHYEKVRDEKMVDLFLRPRQANDITKAYVVDGQEYVVDTRKALRSWRAQKDALERETQIGSVIGPDDAFAARGINAISTFLTKDMAEAMAAGTLDRATFMSLINETVDGMLMGRGSYMPRNSFDFMMSDGTIVTERLKNSPETRAMFASARTVPRETLEVTMHPGDLHLFDELIGNTTAAFRRVMNQSEATIRGAKGPVVVHRIDPVESMQRYIDDADDHYATFLQPLSKDYIKRHHQVWLRAPDEALNIKSHAAPLELSKEEWERLKAEAEAQGIDIPEPGPARVGEFMDQVPWYKEPAGGFNYADALWAEYNMVASPEGRKLIREVIIPGTLGKIPATDIFGRLLARTYRASAQTILGTPALRKVLEEVQDWSQKTLKTKADLIGSLERAADVSIPLGKLRVPGSRSLANLLYAGALAGNMASVALNAMQPAILVAPIHGLKATLYGYREALKDILKYAKVRADQILADRSKLILSDVEKRDLIFKHIRHAELSGLDPDVFATIDAIARGRSGFEPESFRRWLLWKAPMKMFEKTEWLNRLVAAHATEYVSRVSGVTDEAAIMDNIRTFVGQTQFGASHRDAPLLFFNKVLSDPTMRQFLTFPMRTAVSLFQLPILLTPGQGNKAVAFNMFKLWMRSAGYGAIMYEVGKNILGADVSPAVAPAVFTDVLNPEEIFSREAPGGFVLRAPPIIDALTNFVRWVGEPDDVQALRQWLPRFIPMGVAINRVLPALGPIGSVGGALRNLQGTYVDWSHPSPDGLVPVYKADGTLIGYRPPTMMLARALGLDMKGYAAEAEVDRFLAANRDIHSELKREFISSAINGEFARAEEIRQEYKKKFGIDLRFTPASMRQQLVARSVPRAERLLDRISPDIRPQYQQALLSRANRLGYNAEQLVEQATSAARTKTGTKRINPLGPEAEAYLNRYLEARTMQEVVSQLTGGPDRSQKLLDDLHGLLVQVVPQQQEQ